MPPAQPRGRERRTATKSLRNMSALGAASVAVALRCECEAVAFLPSLPPPATFQSTLPGRHDRARTRAPSSPGAPLRMAAKSGGRLISTNEQFEREVLRIGVPTAAAGPPPPVLVLFTAPWCGPCRLMDPVVREVAGRYRGKIDAVHLSTDDLPEVAADAGVQSVPTILV